MLKKNCTTTKNSISAFIFHTRTPGRSWVTGGQWDSKG